MSKSITYRWIKSRVRSFRTLILPCYLEGCVMGLFPYKTSASAPYFVCSKLRQIYATIIILLYTMSAIMTFYRMDITRIYIWPKGDVPDLLRHNCVCLLGVLLTITTYLYSTRRLELFQNLASLYARLPKESFGKIFLYIYTKDIIGFLYLLYYVPMMYDKDPLRAVTQNFLIYSAYTIFVMDMIYIDCVWVLRYSFKHINKALLAAKKAIANNDVYTVRMIFREWKHPLLLAEQKELRKRYNETSDMLDFLNETFSVQVMFTVILSLVEITFGLYFYLFGIIQQKEMNSDDQMWYKRFLYSTIYYFIKLLLIIYSCNAATSEAKKTDVVVQNVLVLTEDRQMRKELRLLSMQAFHRSNTFSANIFTVDAKLLTSIVGNVTTYLLVLIQYLLTQKPVHNRTVNDYG